MEFNNKLRKSKSIIYSLGCQQYCYDTSDECNELPSELIRRKIIEAPVAQGIEHRPPEPGARVRVPPGVRTESKGGEKWQF